MEMKQGDFLEEIWRRSQDFARNLPVDGNFRVPEDAIVFATWWVDEETRTTMMIQGEDYRWSASEIPWDRIIAIPVMDHAAAEALMRRLWQGSRTLQ
jgi:hypothetical protein